MAETGHFIIYDAARDLYFIHTAKQSVMSPMVVPVFNGLKDRASKFNTKEQAQNALNVLKGQHADEFVDCKVVMV